MTKTTATARTIEEQARMKSTRSEALYDLIDTLGGMIDERRRYEWYHVKDEDGNDTGEIKPDEALKIEVYKALQEEILALM